MVEGTKSDIVGKAVEEEEGYITESEEVVDEEEEEEEEKEIENGKNDKKDESVVNDKKDESAVNDKKDESAVNVGEAKGKGKESEEEVDEEEQIEEEIENIYKSVVNDKKCESVVNDKNDKSAVKVGEAKDKAKKLKRKKVEVKKTYRLKKTVKKGGRLVVIWTCGVCKQTLPKTAKKVACDGCWTWCHLDKCSGLKDKSEYDIHTFRCQGCRMNINPKTYVQEAKRGKKRRKSTDEEVPSPKVSPVGKRTKKSIKEVETTTQNEKKEKKAITSKMKNYLKETISKTIDVVVNKETETEQVKNLEIDIEKKKIGINKYSYKLKLGEVNITDEDIQSLEIGQDVTDGIIALAMKLLEEAFDTIVKRDGIRLLSPNLTYLLQRGNKIDVIEEKKNLKINENEWVLYPINNKKDDKEISGGTHWSLLLYSKKDRTYYHFDPIQSMNESHAKHMILNTLDY
ncbi:MAG: hypothetical protein GY775_18725, partial [Candidatus Scalindua sp.]|nr:hypothetical protein [Candidatus Scalindua sp.]